MFQLSYFPAFVYQIFLRNINSKALAYMKPLKHGYGNLVECPCVGHVDTRIHTGHASDTCPICHVAFRTRIVGQRLRIRLVHGLDTTRLFCSVIEPPSRTTGLLTKFRRKKIDNTILTIMTPNTSVFFFLRCFLNNQTGGKGKVDTKNKCERGIKHTGM